MSMQIESDINSKLKKRKHRLAQSNLPEYPSKCSTPLSERSSTPLSECQSSSSLLVKSTAKKDEHSKSKQNDNQCKQSFITNPEVDTIADEQQKQARYEYVKLNDVQQMISLTSEKSVSIYGIIVSYNGDGLMIIKDETCDRFCFFPNLPTSIPLDHLTTTIEEVNSDSLPIANDNNSYSYKTGDVIRVHRLTLNPNMKHRCRAQRNIVIFESFNDEEQFIPISVANNPTIEPQDHERVKELNRWQIFNLLEQISPRSLPQNKEVLNAALLVWNVIDFDKRTIVCCWTPSTELVAEHPCYLSMSFNCLANIMEQNENRHLFSRRLIGRIYGKNQLIFLIVFGKHRNLAKNLKCCDTIIAYEIVRKADSFYPGHYSYLLHDNITYGQCIRIAHPNSLIEKKMHEKMEEYVQNPPQILEMDRFDLDDMYAFDEYLNPCRFDLNPSVQEHDNEQQELHNQRQITNNLAINEQNESKMVKPLSESINDNNDIYSLISDDSLTDEDRDLIMNVSPKSSNETTELIMALDPSITFTIYGQEVEIINQHLFKRSAKLLKGKVSEKDLLHSMRQIERLHIGDHVRLKSHLYSYYGQTRKGDRFFDSIDNFHSFATVVICQNQYHIGTEPCGYQSSLEAYKLSNNGPPIDEGFSGFRCPNCNQLTCELCIDLTIILKDCDGNLLECHWTGLNSNRYFGCSTKELYNIHNDRQKPSFLVRINALLKYLWCASKLSSEKNDRDIIWKIAVCRSKQPETEVEYQIEDVNVLLKPKKKID